MITRLGAPPGGDTGSTILNKFNDLFYMATNWNGDLQAQAYEDWKYGTIPNVTGIVASQGAPKLRDQMLGEWTPEDAASLGLSQAQSKQTQGIKDAEGVTWFPEGNATIPNVSDILGGIPWGTIALVGAVVLGVVVVVPMLGRK